MAQLGFDRRRTNGPEESLPYLYDEDLPDKWSSGKPRKSRGPSDIRPIFLQPGLISQATGSAYIETERTKIACAVYGPRQSKNVAFHEKGRLNVEVKFAPYSCSVRRAPMRDAEDRSVAMAIHQALLSSVRLETFPKATIDIFITIIEEDGIEGCVAAGSIAASTALAHAGIEVFGLVVSCSAAVIGSEIWLDPTAEESKLSTGALVLSCMPALTNITSVWQTGGMTPSQVLSVRKRQSLEAHPEESTDDLSSALKRVKHDVMIYMLSWRRHFSKQRAKLEA
ncbi:Exosome complex component mtr3 [Psilocybe cubensis]|uniref:mRNA transport regulator 3 n=2 Tax=Psilocybe cubensis TaxID=181762 RepID=A0A8H7Y2L2_PSICU|nr:Exosome complex component mtr3 [Psilocybe cubensis]KAH9484252.1 Exosome complex component mtr3 [Psilocybe cubensis]